MLNNKRFIKFNAKLSLISIISSNIAYAAVPRMNQLSIHATRKVEITGTGSSYPNRNLESITYEDIDVTARLPKKDTSDNYVWNSERTSAKKWNLYTKIPYVDGVNPQIDFYSLRFLPSVVSSLSDELHFQKQAGAKQFLENIIYPNQQTLDSNTKVIPDLDCLFYKNVNGEKHLFLRLSSETRKEAELSKSLISDQSIVVENGNVNIISDEDIALDHASIVANNISLNAENRIRNLASMMRANNVIYLKAKDQIHETKINKWIREDRGKDYFVHAEGLASIDNCIFVANKLIQDGETVLNLGISVLADEYEDRATHTKNLPAKETFYNFAWTEENGLFSSSEKTVSQTDDFLVPTRFKVGKYRSVSDKPGSSVEYGYTLINASSIIEVLKDIKRDILVHERHETRVHEESSGISFFGCGANAENPMNYLGALKQAWANNNMVGFTTSSIAVASKALQYYSKLKRLKESLGNPESIESFINAVSNKVSYEVDNFMNSLDKIFSSDGVSDLCSLNSLIKLLSKFINTSMYIGSKSVDIHQETDLTRGNNFQAPTQIFHNKQEASFAGTYKADNMDIKTKTLITFALPQTFDSSMTVQQAGVSIDLLALALACTGAGCFLTAALSAVSISASTQDMNSHQEIYKPTSIQVKNKLNIVAENGYLTQAHIKAGMVYAIFTEDLVLKSLANIRWSKSEGNSFSCSLGGFKNLAADLIDIAANFAFNGSITDSKRFEQVIDDYAYLVGEEEFYLKVGNVLKTESAFFGNKKKDPQKQHIDVNKHINENVEQKSYKNDSSCKLSLNDLLNVGAATYQTIFGDNKKVKAQKASISKAKQQDKSQIAKKSKENEEKQTLKTTLSKIKEKDQKKKNPSSIKNNSLKTNHSGLQKDNSEETKNNTSKTNPHSIDSLKNDLADPLNNVYHRSLYNRQKPTLRDIYLEACLEELSNKTSSKNNKGKQPESYDENNNNKGQSYFIHINGLDLQNPKERASSSNSNRQQKSLNELLGFTQPDTPNSWEDLQSFSKSNQRNLEIDPLNPLKTFGITNNNENGLKARRGENRTSHQNPTSFVDYLLSNRNPEPLNQIGIMGYLTGTNPIPYTEFSRLNNPLFFNLPNNTKTTNQSDLINLITGANQNPPKKTGSLSDSLYQKDDQKTLNPLDIVGYAPNLSNERIPELYDFYARNPDKNSKENIISQIIAPNKSFAGLKQKHLESSDTVDQMSSGRNNSLGDEFKGNSTNTGKKNQKYSYPNNWNETDNSISIGLNTRKVPPIKEPIWSAKSQELSKNLQEERFLYNKGILSSNGELRYNKNADLDEDTKKAIAKVKNQSPERLKSRAKTAAMLFEEERKALNNLDFERDLFYRNILRQNGYIATENIPEDYPQELRDKLGLMNKEELAQKANFISDMYLRSKNILNYDGTINQNNIPLYTNDKLLINTLNDQILRKEKVKSTFSDKIMNPNIMEIVDIVSGAKESIDLLSFAKSKRTVSNTNLLDSALFLNNLIKSSLKERKEILLKYQYEMRAKNAAVKFSDQTKQKINEYYRKLASTMMVPGGTDVFTKDPMKDFRNDLIQSNSWGQSIEDLCSVAVNCASVRDISTLFGFFVDQVCNVCYGSYTNLQRMKSALLLLADAKDLSPEKKHYINTQYKETLPALHRPDSPNVFEGY